MKKFKFANIRNIRFNIVWAWQACIIVFLLVIVVLSLLDVYMFINTEKSITSSIDIPADIKNNVFNKAIFEKAVLDLAVRRAIFEKESKEKPGVKDPSL